MNVVIVGASGGIGRAIVESYRGEDVKLYLCANRGADALEDALRQERDLDSFRVFKADLAERNGASELERATLDAMRKDQGTETPRIDGLVVASGLDLMTPQAKALSFDERLDLIFRIDVASTVRLARSFGAAMRDRARAVPQEDRSSVVLFGWDGVERGQEGETAQLYAASKGAIVAFARSLAQDLAPYVRVNVVSPGWIKTTWGAVASQRAERRVAKESLAERWGRAEEVARAVRFLLSRDASYVNGQTLALNGGFSYRFE